MALAIYLLLACFASCCHISIIKVLYIDMNPLKRNKKQWLEFRGTLGFLLQLADRKG